MRPMPLRACAMLMILMSLSACGRGGAVPEVCPAWLRVVAPIYSHPSDSPRTQDRVAALGEAGQAVGCW